MFGTCTCLRIYITIQNLRLARDCFGDLVKIKKKNTFNVQPKLTDLA